MDPNLVIPPRINPTPLRRTGSGARAASPIPVPAAYPPPLPTPGDDPAPPPPLPVPVPVPGLHGENRGVPTHAETVRVRASPDVFLHRLLVVVEAPETGSPPARARDRDRTRPPNGRSGSDDSYPPRDRPSVPTTSTRSHPSPRLVVERPARSRSRARPANRRPPAPPRVDEVKVRASFAFVRGLGVPSSSFGRVRVVPIADVVRAEVAVAIAFASGRGVAWLGVGGGGGGGRGADPGRRLSHHFDDVRQRAVSGRGGGGAAGTSGSAGPVHARLARRCSSKARSRASRSARGKREGSPWDG